jgi:hypothetical protein
MFILGDDRDFFGGIGSNGALKSNAVSDFELAKGVKYDFKKGVMHNLKADDSIRGHSDITGKEVARAISHAVDVGQ